MSCSARGLLRRHIPALLALAALCLYGCPFYRLFSLPCPGCGLTRAWLCFLRGAWREALAHHLLFLPTPPMLLLLIHRRTPPLADRRFPDVLLPAYFLLLAVYRLLRVGAGHFD